MLIFKGGGPTQGRKPPSLGVRAKPWGVLDVVWGDHIEGGTTTSSHLWFRGSIFWDVLVFHDLGDEISRSWEDLNLFSSKEVLLVKKEHSFSVMSASSLWWLLPPLSFLIHLLLFALVCSEVSKTVFFLTVVFFDSSLCFSSFPWFPSCYHFIIHRDQRGGCFHTLWWWRGRTYIAEPLPVLSAS